MFSNLGRGHTGLRRSYRISVSVAVAGVARAVVVAEMIATNAKAAAEMVIRSSP